MGDTDEQFLAIGDEIAEQLEAWADLADGQQLLDVGCGYGRLAHALKRHGFEGRYLGLDVLRCHVAWCRRHLGGRGWRFRHLDVRNDRYNPSGRLAAEEVELRRFVPRADLIIAASLFTHLEAQAVRRYLAQFAAVLAPGGRIYASFFLLDSRQDNAGEGVMTFPYAFGDSARYQYDDEPLRAVAYPASWLETVCSDLQLEIRRVSYGSWGPAATGAHYQDVAILAAPPRRKR